MDFFGHFQHFQPECGPNSHQSTQKRICKMKVCLSFQASITFYNIFAWAGAEINILGFFLDEKVTYVFRLFGFCHFVCLFFFSLSYLFAAVVDLLLGLLQFKNFQENIIATRNSYHGVTKCSLGQFCFEFFTQILEHFCAHFQLNWWPNHSDLGIIGNIFSPCRTRVYTMPVLVKGDDVRRGIKANAHHGRLQPTQVSMG